MIKGKAKTLDKALYASYQGADAILIPKGYKQNESAEIESFTLQWTGPGEGATHWSQGWAPGREGAWH